MISQKSFGEYRVYQYWVKDPNRKNAELITSTLDLTSFSAYYGKNPKSELKLVRSWICYGDTSKHRPPCKFEEEGQRP